MENLLAMSALALFMAFVFEKKINVVGARSLAS